MCYADDRGFFSNQGRNSKMNDPILPEYKLVRDSVRVPLICKFQQDPMKPDRVMPMIKWDRGFLSNQGDLTLRLINNDLIWSIFENIQYWKEKETQGRVFSFLF